VGRAEDDDGQPSDIPNLYIGQTDDLQSRLKDHDRTKDFWDWAVVFVSTNSGLNRAHITWMEHDLIRRAKLLEQCVLVNSTTPNEPPMAEFERADTLSFLNEALQILPLVGLMAFEKRRRVKVTKSRPEEPGQQKTGVTDTIIVPAKDDGFHEVFIGKDQWYAIRISGGMLRRVKYIAAYRSRPTSAITHWAEVKHIEPYGDAGKYRVVFKGPAKPFDQPLPYADAPSGAMQGPRYVSFEALMSAKTVADLVGRRG
jgi:hypothetical protein